jgi:predicted house-cleaning NTP pyrophosphatase (Maf/HAM1 superfamily)
LIAFSMFAGARFLPPAVMISNVEGDWTSVVGLPVFLLGELMKKAGVGMVR